ncbi:hypothetical protein MMC25_003633 [Agyrium rufum]|nr:hypothetical protein [Agyrium rufum]
MFAARDQENLVHGHQLTAASKSLNQGTRQLQPKTPGNKAPKTPFKIPLNNENEIFGRNGLQTGGKANGKGNENLVLRNKRTDGADKTAFVTPLGLQTRAPLGLKTTNAKARVFQTPAPPAQGNGASKSSQKSATTRKSRPRVSHAEMEKVEVFSGDKLLEEREIEYMPPPVRDLPDLPDDLPELDLSMFNKDNLLNGAMSYFLNEPDGSGLSFNERREMETKEQQEKARKAMEAEMIRDVDSYLIYCIHTPDCPGELCRSTTEARKAAEEQYQRTMIELGNPSKEITSTKKVFIGSKGPSIAISKQAASALSQPNSKNTTPLAASRVPAAPKTRRPSPLVQNKRRTPPPTNPSSTRHIALEAASRTTVGYFKGRATSSTLRKTIDGKPPQPNGRSRISRQNSKLYSKVGVPVSDLAPAMYIQRYGIPEVGSDMWMMCKAAGCFNKDEEDSAESTSGPSVQDWFKEQAEEDFELRF